MTIMYANPVLCAILGWAFRAERVGIMGALGIAVTMLGVVFVAQPPVLFGGHEWSHARMAGASQRTRQQMEMAGIMRHCWCSSHPVQESLALHVLSILKFAMSRSKGYDNLK